MGKIQRLIEQRHKLITKAHKFNKRQQKLAKMHPAVFETMELLANEHLVWDDDFEAIRRQLLTLIRDESRTGLHLRALETLCIRFVNDNSLE